MTRTAQRMLAAGAITLGTAPTVLVLLAAHVAAAPVTFGQYAATAVVRASSTGGDLGASGGLTPLDSGSASIDASLDNSPTAMVLARPVEPGTTFATVNSQLPASVPVPEAQAAYPGPRSTASVGTGASHATATVTATSAVGDASTAAGSSAGSALGATTASTALHATGPGERVTSAADAFASGLDVGGVLSIRGVRGHAEIAASAGGRTTATASLVVGSVRVAGQAVVVDDAGVHAVGRTLPLGPSVAQLTAAANSALAAAGIVLSIAAPIHSVTSTPVGTHASADSGGLQVRITTPVVGGGTAANRATLTLGRVILNESDAPSAPSAAAVPAAAAQPGQAAVSQPGTPGRPGIPGSVLTQPGNLGNVPTAAGTASPSTGGPRPLLLAGHPVPRGVALAALGGWQALTLGAATFALLAVGRADVDEEEHLCPCPG